MRQDLTPIDSAPLEGIVRHAIVLVPANLRRHKHIDPRLQQNLRQRPAVAKYIGQP
ncbi:hypothetical protein D3C73_774800 [compost metagenome]